MGHSGRQVRLVFQVKPAERSFFRRPGELCHVVSEHLEGLQDVLGRLTGFLRVWPESFFAETFLEGGELDAPAALSSYDGGKVFIDI